MEVSVIYLIYVVQFYVFTGSIIEYNVRRILIASPS
jgi:hypothetical protein